MTVKRTYYLSGVAREGKQEPVHSKTIFDCKNVKKFNDFLPKIINFVKENNLGYTTAYYFSLKNLKIKMENENIAS